MNFESYCNMVSNFFYANKIIAVIVALVLVVFVWKKPGEAIRLGIFLAVMVVVFYMITLMGGAMSDGVDGKDDMNTRTEELLQE